MVKTTFFFSSADDCQQATLGGTLEQELETEEWDFGLQAVLPQEPVTFDPKRLTQVGLLMAQTGQKSSLIISHKKEKGFKV